MIQEHFLKTINPYFTEVWEGRKPFEVRVNDRNFTAGDEVTLKEYSAIGKTYTGRKIHGSITYVLQDEQFCKKGFCIFGVQVLRKILNNKNDE